MGSGISVEEAGETDRRPGPLVRFICVLRMRCGDLHGIVWRDTLVLAGPPPFV
jgi:hypothetical protein